MRVNKDPNAQRTDVGAFLYEWRLCLDACLIEIPLGLIPVSFDVRIHSCNVFISGGNLLGERCRMRTYTQFWSHFCIFVNDIGCVFAQ
jgi:hypothetical protein